MRHHGLNVEVGLTWGSVEDPPIDGAMAVSGRHCTSHVAHEGDLTGVGIDCPGPNYKRDHQHMGHRLTRYPGEGGGGADRHPSTRDPPVA